MTAEHAILLHIPHAAAILGPAGAILDRNTRFNEVLSISTDGNATFLGAITPFLAGDSRWIPSGNWERDRRALLEGRRVRLTGNRAGPYRIALAELGGERLLCTAVSMDGSDLPGDGVDRSDSDVDIVDALLRTHDDAVCLLDASSRILRCNEIALEFAHTGDGAVRGRPVAEALPLRQGGRPLEIGLLVSQALRSGTDLVVSSDVVARTQGGGEIEVELAVFPLEHRSQNGPACVLAIRNAGERRRVWNEIRRVQHAEDIARAAAGIAHELNNSGTTLISQLGLLLENESPSPRLLRDMEAAIRRVRRLAFQLERFSNIRRHGTEQDSLYLSRDQLTETIQDTVSLAVSGSSIQTSFVIDPALPGVTIPQDQLSQAFYNVLTNAVDAMSDGGLLHVEARYDRHKRMVNLEVRDEGDGMDPRIVADVIKPYFSTKNDGTGMGLTVAYSVIRDNGGTIEIDTNPGFGTSVTICLPASDPMDGPTFPGPETRRATPDLANTVVLLVEDDPLVRRSMERTLQSVGCRVTPVHGGEQALDLFRERVDGAEPFTVLMTDLTMPGRYDGVQLLRRIRELDPDIPAVLCSGVLHRSNITEYRDAGFQTILRKPFGVPEIVSALTEALQRDE